MNGEIVRCRSCRAECFWVKTEKGKSMLLDAEADPRGKFILDSETMKAIYVTAANENDESSRWTSHFATCPNARQHRRPK